MKNGIKFIIFAICCLAIAPIELFVVYKTIGIEGVSFFKLMGALFIFSIIARVIYESIFRKVLDDFYDGEDVSTFIVLFCSISYIVGYTILGKIMQDIGWFRAIIQALLFAIPNIPGMLPLYWDGLPSPKKKKNPATKSSNSGSKSSSAYSVDSMLSNAKTSFEMPDGTTVYQDESGKTIGTSSRNANGETTYWNENMKFIGTSVGNNGNEKFYDSNLSYKGQSEKDANGDTSFYDKDLGFKGKSRKNSNGTSSYHKN